MRGNGTPMVKYLLDTNICIYLMKEQPELMTKRFDECEPGEIAVSAVTWAELCAGMGTHISSGRKVIEISIEQSNYAPRHGFFAALS